MLTQIYKVIIMNVEILLFYVFSSIALMSSVMVISARNPIHSILFLILVFCNAAGLLILLEVEFLAMLFLIVYVGAISVLFLFVIMMLNIKLTEFNQNILRYLPIGGIIVFIFMIEVLSIIDADLIPLFINNSFYSVKYILCDLNSVSWINTIEFITNSQALGNIIYTYYFALFILAGILLLVSMIGAIVLTLNKRTNARKQNIIAQLSSAAPDYQ